MCALTNIMYEIWRKWFKLIVLTIRNWSHNSNNLASYSSWVLLDNLEHLLLDEFFFEHQPIFVPDEVGLLRVDIVFLHAPFEQIDDVAVVWILSEAETSAVVHEFLELLRLVLA